MTRRRRAILVTLVAAVLVLAAALTAALVLLPGLARRAVETQIRAVTGREVAIEVLDVDIWTGRVVVRGFRLADRAGAEPLATFERLEGRVRRRSLLRGRVWLEDVTLTRPRVRIVRTGPATFNISDLLERRRPARRPLDVTVDRFTIVDGEAALEDRTLSPARTWTSAAIALEARNVSTFTRGGTASGSTIVAGAPVSLHVSDLRLYPVHLRAQLTVGALDLALARLYLPPTAVVSLEQGRISAGATIVLDARDGTRIDAGMRLTRLALGRRGQTAPLASSPEITVTVNGLHVAEGQTTVGHLEMDGDVEIVDGAVDPPARLPLTAVRAVADDVTWPPRVPGRVSLAATLKGGTLSVAGSVQASPQRADVRVRLARVPAAPLAAYLPVSARIDGVADADLAIVAMLGGGRTEVTAQGSASLTRAALADPSAAGGGPSPLTAERVAATGIDVRWPDRVTIARLHVLRPSARIERTAAGELPLRALFARKSTSATAQGTTAEGAAQGATAQSATARPAVPALTVTELVLEGVSGVFDDRAVRPQARYEVRGASLTARDVSWPPAGPARVQAAVPLPGGGDLAATGTVRLDPLAARLSATLRGAALAQAQPYLPFPARVRGTADAQVDLGIETLPLRLRARGRAGVRELGVSDGGRDVLTVESAEAGGIDARWPGRLSVRTLAVRKPWAAIERDARGQLSLRAVFTRRPGAAGAAPADAAAPGAPFEVAIADALFEDGSTSIVDDIVDPPARFEIPRARLAVQGLTWPSRAPVAVQLTATMPGSGQLDARGTFQIDPPSADLKVALAGVDIRPAQPYLPISGRVGGRVDGTVALRGDFAAGRILARGDAAITRFFLGDADRPLVRLARAAVDEVEIRYARRQVRIGRVTVQEPWVLIERDERGDFPLAALLRPRRTTPPRRQDRPADTTPSPPVSFSIGTIAVTNGTGRFVDRTTTPDFAEDLSALSATVQELSTAGARPAQLTVSARIGAAAQLTIEGSMGALGGPRFLDISAALHDYAIPRGNPYYDRLVGWIARQGNLGLRVHYRVDGDDLEATNEIDVSGLAIEESGTSQEAIRRIGLPLDLVVALLKNPRGEIHVNVPVGGRLSSPEFDFSEAVWGALRNLTIRLVALPFAAIGKMLFTEDSRIQTLAIEPVSFTAGTTSLAPGMAEHLTKVAGFLRDTPAAKLLLRPVLTVADVAPLKRQAVLARVRAAARDGTPAAIAEAAARLFAQRFPRQPLPATTDAIVDALAAETPPRQSAVRELASARVDATRAALAAAGIAAERLPAVTTAPPVESEGDGRVEFDLTH